MDPERALISRIILDRTLAGITDSGITRVHFTDVNARKVFDYLTSYYQDHGVVPTSRELAADAPWYPLEEVVQETTGSLVSRLLQYRALDVIEEELLAATHAYEADDVQGVFTILSRTLSSLVDSQPNLRDTNLVDTWEERLARYNSEAPDALRGIPSGFPTIDQATQGFQKQQLVTFVGPPKAGKSTMMLLAALNAHRLGFSPLLIGFEMTNEEQEERIDSIEAHISHHRLRGRSLMKVPDPDDPDKTIHERDLLRRGVHRIAARRDFWLSNDSQSTTTLTGVANKVEKYKPDLLIVDGVYMMQDENGEPPGSWKALTNISRGFKRMAQNLDLPIIITTQVLEGKMDKQRGVTSYSIGYSSSFAQDSDVIIGVEKTDVKMVNKVKIVAARNCPNLETYVRWDWETGYFEEEKDAYGDTEADSGGDDERPRSRHEVEF